MEEISSKRSSGGPISRRAPNLVLRDSAENNRDRNVPVCSRVGCSSKLHAMKDAQVGSPSKVKTPKTPVRSSALGKETIGSSSKTVASPNTPRKSFSDMKKKLPSHLSTDSETCNLHEKSEKVSGKTRMRVHPEPEDRDSVEVRSSDAGSSSAGCSNRFVKRNTQRFGMGRQDSAARSSAAFAAKQANQSIRNGGTSTSKYNLRHIKCNSISDIAPSSSSLNPESSLSKKDAGGRKRVGEAESSLSVRGKKKNGSTKDDRRNDYSNRGISISDSRRHRCSSPGNNDAGSIRARRLSSRTRLSDQESQDVLPLVESTLMNPSSPQTDLSTDAIDDFMLENQFSDQTPVNHFSPFIRPLNSNEHVRPNRSAGPYEAGTSRSFMNRDSLREYNLDGIAEMLLALERIEQEEPTYEQLLVLENNIFLGGLGFHDQHRDMRLDIDNMSYEELLALEERMGTVSTGVPEDVLAKCLKRSIYQGIAECNREDENDVKCSICQEEYAAGEEVGRLSCDHRYHNECIDEWLRLKNWCPICKTSVAPSPSASLPP